MAETTDIIFMEIQVNIHKLIFRKWWKIYVRLTLDAETALCSSEEYSQSHIHLLHITIQILHILKQPDAGYVWKWQQYL
jgi:hypothetical protein